MTGVVRAIWLHQWNLAGLTSWDQLRQQWQGTVYVKALDGISWMSEFDPSPLAVNDAEGRSPFPGWQWGTVDALPWTVPTAENIGKEGALTHALLDAARSVILDLEPYEHFWRGTEQQLYDFFVAIGVIPGTDLAITLDYRRLPWPGDDSMRAASRILPQCYWTTFQRNWMDVLDAARDALRPYSAPIEYVLPGDSNPSDLRNAIDWVAAHGATASIWLWQTITPENWEVIIENAADQPPAMPPVDDLVTLLGYLQGDVADAFQTAIDHLQDPDKPADIDAVLDELEAAVNTLRNAGK